MTNVQILTEDEIANILGSVRERGVYKRLFTTFVDQDTENGWNVSKHFNGKKSATVYQGFNNVKKEDPDKFGMVRVINHEDTVYLIKTDAPVDTDED